MALTVIVAGCGDSPKVPEWPEPVPASGKVTLNDKPLDQARVLLSPKGSTPGHGASGVTNASGEFTLSTLTPKGEIIPGAIPGEYKVTISRMVKSDGSVLSPESKEPPILSGGMESMPLFYSDINQTRLLANVTKTPTPILLQLKK
jgi:hypothetical protein